MHEQQIYLIDKDIRTLPSLSVLSDSVKDRIEDDQHTYSSQLLAEFEDIVADEAV